MKTAIATASLLVMLARGAAAQPGMTPPPEPAPPAPAPAPAPVGEPYSENSALMLSLGGTIGSWVLLLSVGNLQDRGYHGAARAVGLVGGLGILLAPSAGHWYAGTAFTRGLGIRLAGAAGVAIGLGMVLGATVSEADGGSDNGATGAVIMLLGAGALVAGTVDDIVTAPRRVRKRNAERGFALAPLVTPGGAGLALGGRF